MLGTQTHTKSFAESTDSGKLRALWDRFFELDVLLWAKWHDYWIKIAREGNIPIYFFRFEDLLLDPEPVLKDMFKYILGVENVDESVIEKRIQDTINTGSNFIYKPRNAGGGFHKCADKISKEQMEYMMHTLEPFMYFFGYAKDDRSLSTQEFAKAQRSNFKTS